MTAELDDLCPEPRSPLRRNRPDITPALLLRWRFEGHFMGRRPRTWSLRIAALLLLAFGGCSQQPFPQDSQSSPRFGGGVSVDQSANNGRRLAISHKLTLLIPNSGIESQQQKHLAECTKLGCVVVNT
jgi:hypothetical protein